MVKTGGKMKAVDVEWFDPQSISGWLSIEEACEAILQPMFARGWLVKKNKEYIKLSLNKSYEEDRVSDLLILPRGCVKSIKVVKDEADHS